MCIHRERDGFFTAVVADLFFFFIRLFNPCSSSGRITRWSSGINPSPLPVHAFYIFISRIGPALLLRCVDSRQISSSSRPHVLTSLTMEIGWA